MSAQLQRCGNRGLTSGCVELSGTGVGVVRNPDLQCLLTSGGNKSHHGPSQATNMASLNMELGRDMHDQLL